MVHWKSSQKKSKGSEGRFMAERLDVVMVGINRYRTSENSLFFAFAKKPRKALSSLSVGGVCVRLDSPFSFAPGLMADRVRKVRRVCWGHPPLMKASSS